MRLERAQQCLQERSADRQPEHRQRREQGQPQRPGRGQKREPTDDEVPLRQERHELRHAALRMVDRLERSAAPGAVVDAPAPARRLACEAVSVEAAAPGDVPAGGVLLRPLALQLGLGSAVAPLLAPVSAHRLAAVVPNDGGRAEAERQPSLAQPPADVHVVAGRVESGVEAADLLQRLPAKGHVAAGDVLGLLVGEQHVCRPARRVGDAAGDYPVLWEGEIGATNAGVGGGHEGARQVLQPVRIWLRVVVDVGDDFAGSHREPRVSRGGEPAILSFDQAAVVLGGDCR